MPHRGEPHPYSRQLLKPTNLRQQLIRRLQKAQPTARFRIRTRRGAAARLDGNAAAQRHGQPAHDVLQERALGDIASTGGQPANLSRKFMAAGPTRRTFGATEASSRIRPRRCDRTSSTWPGSPRLSTRTCGGADVGVSERMHHTYICKQGPGRKNASWSPTKSSAFRGGTSSMRRHRADRTAQQASWKFPAWCSP